MSLEKIINSHSWGLQKLAETAQLNITLHLSDPPLEAIMPLLPKERLLLNKQVRKQHLAQLQASGLLTACVPFPSDRHPRGAKCVVSVDALRTLCDSDAVSYICIDQVDGRPEKKRRKQKKQQFFCVKTTVGVQVEGIEQGLQLCEERLLLIRATSCEEACQKVQAGGEEYAQPYLNPDGRFVRWQLESVDDCYETSLTELSDLDEPAGVEVFSVLKRRRMTPARAWNGKAEG